MQVSNLSTVVFSERDDRCVILFFNQSKTLGSVFLYPIRPAALQVFQSHEEGHFSVAARCKQAGMTGDRSARRLAHKQDRGELLFSMAKFYMTEVTPPDSSSERGDTEADLFSFPPLILPRFDVFFPFFPPVCIPLIAPLII